MISEMDADLARRIRDDNRRLHDAPGYADFYDDQLGLIRNPWEQRVFRDDLARIAQRLPPRFHALDLGCGTGNLTLTLLDLGAIVTGVDLSAAMLQRLKSKLALSPSQGAGRAEGRHSRAAAHPTAPPALIATDVDDFLRACPDRFQLVCACSFLHHLPDYLATLAAAARHVAPGGCLYVAHEPLAIEHADRLGRALEWLDFRWRRLEARTGLGGRVRRDDPYHDPASLADYWAMNRGLDPAAIERTLRAAGLDPRITTGDSKRHRLLHIVARWFNTRHLLKLEAWRRA